jgi:putative transposase
MALDYSAWLSLLSQLKDTDLTDRFRTALERVYQELIDAEAAEMIGGFAS